MAKLYFSTGTHPCLPKTELCSSGSYITGYQLSNSLRNKATTKTTQRRRKNTVILKVVGSQSLILLILLEVLVARPCIVKTELFSSGLICQERWAWKLTKYTNV